MENKMKIGYLITGRLKSTRLPKKLLLEIKGKPIISHMIERLKLAQKVDEIVICTSSLEQDKPLENIAKNNNVKCYFGSADDVLDRLLGAADKYDFDYILNITADCPFVDPFYADMIVEEFLKTDADLIRQFDLPHGVFSYGIKVEALRKVVELKDSTNTEVWGKYFTDTGMFDVIDLDVENDNHRRPELRMTLDYREDFLFFEQIFDNLYNESKIFSLDDIIRLLNEKPEIVNINKDCTNRFRRRWNSQSEIQLKKIQKVSSALIIGAGSIGQRHIRNLLSLGINRIIALRSNKGHFKALPSELNIIEVDSIDSAIKYSPDVAFISNPTSLHAESAINISPYVKGIFIEKPISNSLKTSNLLVKEINNNNNVSFVGHNLMFHPIVQNIIQCMSETDLGKIINIQCQVGQFLPGWHPYENYKKAYYSRRDLGGGVSFTLIHEINLALSLSGLPTSVFGITSNDKILDIDVDTRSDLMIRHLSGAVSQIHLDYLQQPDHRSGLITFEKGWMSYDFNELILKGVFGESPEPKVIWNDSTYDSNQMYVDQIKQFIQYVECGRFKHNYDAASAIESIKVVDALLRSSHHGKIIEIERNERHSF
jgi:spore coat polysaccharide biosynthesis protein SpsF